MVLGILEKHKASAAPPKASKSKQPAQKEKAPEATPAPAASAPPSTTATSKPASEKKTTKAAKSEKAPPKAEKESATGGGKKASGSATKGKGVCQIIVTICSVLPNNFKICLPHCAFNTHFPLIWLSEGSISFDVDTILEQCPLFTSLTLFPL